MNEHLHSARTPILVGLLAYVGMCEVLATIPEIDWYRVPDWIGMLVLPVGFVAVLALAGSIGNAIVAVGFGIYLRRALGWPLWQSALLSLPFWIMTYRLSPKPW